MDFRIDAVGVVVSDLPRAISFYSRLGCRFPHEPGTQHAQADLGGWNLMLDTVELMAELGWAHGIGPRTSMSLAVRCDAPETVDTLFAELDAEGFGLRRPFDAPWGQRYASVHDPDGTQVDLYAWLPS
jgi:catechol 2,3-dioxygenase-like lactoylglutathione lyase family enzyme